MTLDVIGFGSLNLDEFWEVPQEFFESHGLMAGHEYVKTVDWFSSVYPSLIREGSLKAVDPGGSAANMTAAMRRMGFSTGFFGAAGSDGLENLRIEELGARPDLAVDVLDGPTGRCLCLINIEDPNRDRCLVILPNVNDMAGSMGLDKSYFENSKWIHMTSFVSKGPLEAQKEVVSSMAPETGLSFDPGAVYSRLGMDELLPILKRSSALFTTDEELAQLTTCNDIDRAIDTLLQTGVGIVITKMGPKGLMATTAHESITHGAVKPRLLVDTTGAGDVAAAGFIAGMLSGLNLDVCLELAARTASKSIEGYGRSAYPDDAFIKAFLRDNVSCS